VTSRFSRVSLAAFCAAVCLSVVGSANAWAPIGAKWFEPTLQMHLNFPAPQFPLRDGSLTYYRSFENALQLWNEQLRDFQFTWSEDGVPQNGNGMTEASMQTSVYSYGFGAGVLAVTFLNYSNGRMQEADVVFNVNQYTFDSYFGFKGNGQDFHRIAIHELGHVLGLDHPDQNHPEVGYVAPRPPPDAVMNSIETKFDVLQDDDIAGGQALYGARANAPASAGNGHVANISTRVQVGTDTHVMIGGFIVVNASKPVLVRALGPSLAGSGVSGALADPVLELHDKNGSVIATNNNWKENPAQAQLISSTGAAPSNDLESAIYANLTPGNYTAVVSGNNRATGVGLVEVYDLAQTSGKIANISTRADVGTDENVLIGGFILTGPQAVRVMIRGIGPSLASQGVDGALADPTLEVHDANGGLLASNDDWVSWQTNDPTMYYAIQDSGVSPTNSKESALIAYLAPGNFTAIVRGKNNGTGVGLVEVYDIGPP
jgi:hypothetical protein